MQPVAGEGKPVVRHAGQAAEQLPVRDGDAAQRRIVVIRAAAGVIRRNFGKSGADIAAAVDEQRRVGNFRRHVDRILDVTLPIRGGFANLRAGVKQIDFCEIADGALLLDALNPPVHRIRLMRRDFYALHSIGIHAVGRCGRRRRYGVGCARGGRSRIIGGGCRGGHERDGGRGRRSGVLCHAI